MTYILEDLPNGETRLRLVEMEAERKWLQNIANGFLPKDYPLKSYVEEYSDAGVLPKRVMEMY